MDTKQKYIRLKQYNEIIIFPEVTKHSIFKHMNPISAGFCHVTDNKVSCFGESIGLDLKSKEDDSFHATKQLFGWDAADKLTEDKN